MTYQDFRNAFLVGWASRYPKPVLDFCGMTIMPPSDVLPFGQLALNDDHVVPPNDLEHEQARIAAGHDLSLATGVPIDLFIHCLMEDPMWVFYQRRGQPDYAGIAGGTIPTVYVDMNDYPGTLARLASLYPPLPKPAPPPPPAQGPLGIDLGMFRTQDPTTGALVPAQPPEGREVFMCNPSGYGIPNGEPVTIDGVVYVKAITPAFFGPRTEGQFWLRQTKALPTAQAA